MTPTLETVIAALAVGVRFISVAACSGTGRVTPPPTPAQATSRESSTVALPRDADVPELPFPDSPVPAVGTFARALAEGSAALTLAHCASAVWAALAPWSVIVTIPCLAPWSEMVILDRFHGDRVLAIGPPTQVERLFVFGMIAAGLRLVFGC